MKLLGWCTKVLAISSVPTGPGSSSFCSGAGTPALERQRVGDFGEAGRGFVALAERGLADRPLNADVGVVPGDARLGGRVIDAGEQVGDVRDVAEDGEAVAEAGRHEELAVGLVV